MAIFSTEEANKNMSSCFLQEEKKEENKQSRRELKRTELIKTENSIKNKIIGDD